MDDNQNFTISLKHKKCGLIKHVKSQMQTAENKFCAGCTSTRWFSCWTYNYSILVIVAVLIFAWACIIYGTVIGAALCSSGGAFVPLFNIPGLKWSSKYNAKDWKVF